MSDGHARTTDHDLRREISVLTSELEACRAQTRERNRELDAFLYTISHDLKAPLVSIEGFASQLLRQHSDRLDPGVRFRLERICSNAQLTQDLLTALLELSRIGRLDGPHERVQMDEMVSSLLEERADEIQRRGIDLDVGPLPELVAEPRRIRQLFGALLDNAIQYMGPEPPSRIRIASRETGPDWEITVVDTGLGIPENQLERIFGTFQRHHVKERSGIGMGLTFARRIAETHGGTLEVESEGEGKGSLFRVRLARRSVTAPA